ncbi:hypothetical protein PROFUN_01673 [Planoprotostelium fungivorum]|uniref:Uncharacterized protein n=1 Tax=Planoprotostelium fungivorum TaxID=1890364 RepID=A0A2P6MW80_9EUKA|nr:hypothetical protein PROFUN_01673 [Planoprotostelium fungivorum]
MSFPQIYEPMVDFPSYSNEKGHSMPEFWETISMVRLASSGIPRKNVEQSSIQQCKHSEQVKAMHSSSNRGPETTPMLGNQGAKVPINSLTEL